MRYDDAYDAGFGARTRGEPITACTYQSQQWREAWAGGWRVADNRISHDRMTKAMEQTGRDLLGVPSGEHLP